MTVFIGFTMATPACEFIGVQSVPNRVVIRTRLPTLTATVAPISMANSTPSAAETTASPADPGAIEAPLTPFAPAPAPTSGQNAQGVDLSVATLPSTPAITSETLIAVTAPVAQPTITSTPTSLTTDFPQPADTFHPTPTIIPVMENGGWSFEKLNLIIEENGLVVYGEMMNNTGIPQELSSVTGAFYDAQGQVIAGANNTEDYWPVDTIPQGGRVPFSLTVAGAQSIADFELYVEAGPSRETPRQDFEFLGLSQESEAFDYCVAGKLRNPGNELESFLTIVIILYGSREEVINFGNHYEHSPQAIVGDQTLDFRACADSRGQQVSRYELRAWGL